MIEHNWNPKIIKSAFQKIERGLKNNGKPRTQPSFPKLKEDLEETTISTSSGTNRDSARGISRASSNESGASPSITGEFAQRGNIQIGTITPKENQHNETKNILIEFGSALFERLERIALALEKLGEPANETQ